MSATGVLEVREKACRIGDEMGTVNGSKSDNRMPPPHVDLTFQIIGAAMRVHNRLGPGLKEAFYQRELSAELAAAGLDFTAEQPIEISIDGRYVGRLYLDHLVVGEIVVEEKAFPHMLTPEETAQVITYLAAAGKPVGLLLNFGRQRLEYKRILRPRNNELWRARIRRYVWLPPELRSAYSLPYPLTVPPEAVR